MSHTKNTELLKESFLALIVSLADFLFSLIAFAWSFINELVLPQLVRGWQWAQKVKNGETSVKETLQIKINQVREVVGEERAEKAEQLLKDLKSFVTSKLQETASTEAEETEAPAELPTLAADTSASVAEVELSELTTPAGLNEDENNDVLTAQLLTADSEVKETSGLNQSKSVKKLHSPRFQVSTGADSANATT